jgi:acetyl esterase/lipase
MSLEYDSAERENEEAGFIDAYGVKVPPPLPPDRTIAFGDDVLQSLDFWQAKPMSAAAPLIFFVHGGAWCAGDKALDTGYWKAKHFPEAGYALASVNYRLVPQATVEQQVADVVSALRAIVDRADELGIDAQRIVMMGHSASAHLAALVGTDESHLHTVGLTFANIAGVVGNDGASYDAARQIADIDPDWRPVFVEAFGSDQERLRRLSPTFQTAAPNAPDFLLLHMPHRADGGIRQAHDLADALRAAGSNAAVVEVDAPPLTGHHEMNQRLGEPGHGTTLAVDEWLKEVFKS